MSTTNEIPHDVEKLLKVLASPAARALIVAYYQTLLNGVGGLATNVLADNEETWDKSYPQTATVLRTIDEAIDLIKGRMKQNQITAKGLVDEIFPGLVPLIKEMQKWEG